MTESKCPECGGPLTSKGMKINGETTKWQSCLNCQWDNTDR